MPLATGRLRRPCRPLPHCRVASSASTARSNTYLAPVPLGRSNTYLAPVPLGVLGILTVHQDVIARATADRWWLIAVMLPGAVAYVYDGFFLGLTAGRLLRNAMAISLIAFLLPGLIAVRLGSNHLLWLALASFMLVRAWLLGREVRPALAGPTLDAPDGIHANR